MLIHFDNPPAIHFRRSALRVWQFELQDGGFYSVKAQPGFVSHGLKMLVHDAVLVGIGEQIGEHQDLIGSASERALVEGGKEFHVDGGSP